MKTRKQCPNCEAYDVEYYESRELYQCLSCAYHWTVSAEETRKIKSIAKQAKEGAVITIGGDKFRVGPSIKAGYSSFGLFKFGVEDTEEDDQPEPTNIPPGFDENGDPRI